MIEMFIVSALIGVLVFAELIFNLISVLLFFPFILMTGGNKTCFRRLLLGTGGKSGFVFECERCSFVEDGLTLSEWDSVKALHDDKKHKKKKEGSLA